MRNEIIFWYALKAKQLRRYFLTRANTQPFKNVRLNAFFYNLGLLHYNKAHAMLRKRVGINHVIIERLEDL